MASERIALYIGNEMYPVNGASLEPMINQLHSSPLTSPILSLVNQSGANPDLLVYNDASNPIFDSSGNYVGDPTWADAIAQLKNGGNVKEVYLSFSSNGTEFLANHPAAASKIFSYVVNELGFDGIDFDYEDGDFSNDGPIMTVARLAAAAKVQVTSAPYTDQGSWQDWIDEVHGNGGTVSWLNLQCYAGGKYNNPGDWLNMGVPIVAGSCNNCCCEQTTCSPSDMQALFRLWRTGAGQVSPACWKGTPNSGPQNIGGGFIWVLSSIQNDFFAYMNAMASGLGV